MTFWLVSNLGWATLLMLLVLAVRRPFAAVFGACPAYALWLLPAVRLATPPLPALDIPSPISEPTLLLLTDSRAPGIVADASFPWVILALIAWGLGAILFLIWQWLSYRRFLTELSLSSRSVGAHRGLPLVESRAVQGPLALGLLDRRIVVPADFETRYAPEERRLALDHEAVHHRRGDIWWNHLGLVMLALSWFNPVAWIAFRAFRTDQELACDAAVAAAASAEARHDYARALVKSASRPGLIAACPLNHAAQLKRRLKMIKNHKNSSLRMFGGGAAVAMLTGVALTFGGTGLAHPHPESEGKDTRIERVVVMKHDGDHKAGDRTEHRDHVIRMRRGTNGAIELPENCNEGDRIADVNEGSGDRRTRILLCSRGEADGATRLERLRRVRERMASNEHLGEHRDEVLAAIDREIARLRGN